MLKSIHSMGYRAVADNMGLSSFVSQLLRPKPAKTREIFRKFELTAVRSHPMSSILVPIESAYAISYM